VAVDTPVRIALSALKVTMVQTTIRTRAIEAVIGLFQGICGSVLYSVPIAFGLFYLWFKVYDHEPWKAKHPSFVATAVGGVMGLLSGGIISVILVWAQNPVTLHDASWTLTEHPSSPWVVTYEAWVVTRVAWSMAWFGLWIGATVALAILRIISDGQWAKFLANQPSITDPGIGLTVLLSLLKTAFLSSLRYVFPALLIAGGLFCFLPNDPVSRTRIFGESIAVAVGGVGFITGFLASLFSLTKGADIPGDRKCSLQPPVT
jgi:hypothetical protein